MSTFNQQPMTLTAGASSCRGLLLLLLAAFWIWSGALAQTRSDSVAPGHGNVLAPQRAPEGGAVRGEKYLYREAILTFRDGRIIEGLFAGAASDSIRIWQHGAPTSAGSGEVRSLRFGATEHPEVAGVHGILYGAYLGFLLGSRALSTHSSTDDARRFSYLEPGASDPWIAAAFGAFLVGGAAYGLAGASDFSGEKFDFSGDVLARQAEMKRLAGPDAEPEPARFHFGISAGFVFFRRELPQFSQFGGYTVEHGFNRSSVTAMRMLKITYSITPWAEAGLAVVDFSEPLLSGFGFNANVSANAEQSSRNVLFGLVGQVKPLQSVLPTEISLDFGAVLGLASLDYRSSVVTHSYDALSDSVVLSESINARRFGVSVFTGLVVYPYRTVSVALTADYTLAPGVSVRAVPPLGLDPRTLGNACIGIEVGAHF